MALLLSFLSPISLYAYYLRSCFTSAGLSRHSVHIDSDTTIYLWASTNPTPHKPSLIFIHGFGPDALWQWRRQVQFFSPHFNIYVPDLVFFGESTTTSLERSEIFQAKSVAKCLEKLGVQKYSVVGTSYGGFVTYHMARMWPEKVEKVVIASSGVNMKKSDNDELVIKSKLKNISDLMLPKEASHLRALVSLAVHRRLSMIPDIFLNDFIQKLYTKNRSLKLELLKGLSFARDETVNISPLQQDVLLVWGDNDRIFPLEMAVELKELIGFGKEVKLETIKGASHVPQIEKAQQFNNILNSFLT